MPRFPSAQGRLNHEPDSTLAVTKTCPKDGVHLCRYFRIDLFGLRTASAVTQHLEEGNLDIALFGKRHSLTRLILLPSIDAPRCDTEDREITPRRRGLLRGRDSFGDSWKMLKNRSSSQTRKPLKRKCRGWGSNPHGACAPQDFKSCASASFATSACV